MGGAEKPLAERKKMSKIAWTDKTWNPVVGCTKVSEGCKNCYAEKMACRLANMGQKKYEDVLYSSDNGKSGVWNGKIVCIESALDKPLHWKKPRRIFVCSMGDLFHPQVPDLFICKVHDVVNKCSQHTFQILTKRPQNMYNHFIQHPCLNNVHLGVSVENAKNLWRGLVLKDTPAPQKFISFEPLLGPIDFVKPNRGEAIYGKYIIDYSSGEQEWFPDYIIIGAESIGGAAGRECKLEWIESLVEQAKAAGVPCGVKQIHVGGKLLKYNKKTESWPDAWPEHLRIWEI